MDKEKFGQIEKILDNADSIGGGPLETRNIDGAVYLNFENLNMVMGDMKNSDVLIHIQYFPPEKRYGFAVYKKEDKK